MAKLTALLLSDTHGHHRHPILQTIKSYDLLIHAGDFTDFGKPQEVDDFLQWLHQQTQFKDIIYIAGNHDIGYTSTPYSKSGHTPRVHYLCESSVCINGINFYGSPHTPRFFDWAFMYDPPEAKAIWSRIPQNTNVLITHGPPYGVMDQCPDINGTPTSAGCPTLLDAVAQLPGLGLHVFGHIHEGHGVVHHDNGHVSVNTASICNSLKHSPIEFIIDTKADPVMSL